MKDVLRLNYSACIPWALFFFVFTIYAWSCSQAVSNWDTAELQTVPYILGIPHPSGFPLFVLLGWVVTHIFAVNSVAWRMNALSSLCLAATAAIIYKVGVRLGGAKVTALLGALIFCSGALVLKKATHTDVHAMSTLWFACVVYYLIDCDFVLVGLFEGLGLATHLTAIWWLPAIGLAFLVRRPSWSVVLRSAALCVTVTAILYAYLPLRSAFPGHDPNLDLGITSGAFWNTNHPNNVSGFLEEVTGSDFGAKNAVLASFNPAHLLDWVALVSTNLAKEFSLTSICLAALGLTSLILRGKVTNASILLFAGLGSVPFAFAYSAVEGDVARYLLPSFVIYAVFMSCYAQPTYVLSVVYTTAQAIVLALLVTTNLPSALNERTDTGGTSSIEVVKSLTPDNAIIVTLWIDAASFAYARYVENNFGSRYIVSEWPGALKGRYPTLRSKGPVFVYVPPSNLSNLTDVVPKKWLRTIPLQDTGHTLTEICSSGCF